MSTLSARHGWTLRKDDGVLCTCKPVNPRHRYGPDCLSTADVDAFAARTGCGPRVARYMYWLWREFSGEAK